MLHLPLPTLCREQLLARQAREAGSVTGVLTTGVKVLSRALSMLLRPVSVGVQKPRVWPALAAGAGRPNSPARNVLTCSIRASEPLMGGAAQEARSAALLVRPRALRMVAMRSVPAGASSLHTRGMALVRLPHSAVEPGVEQGAPRLLQ